MSPSKLNAISDFEAPRNKSELMRFLGMVVWYKRFIKNLTLVSQPLTELLKKSIPGKPQVGGSHPRD